ncbi:MAG: DUF2267 domain-containing protein [Nitrospiria bacterium]
MTMPMEYGCASQVFEQFLRDALGASGLTSRHQVYTMTQGVFQAFRPRLDVRDTVRFANVLSPILRAIFVADWNLDEPKRPFENRDLITKEVQSLRGEHNFSPETAIKDVATALRKNMNEATLDSLLATLPEGAAEFWRV